MLAINLANLVFYDGISMGKDVIDASYRELWLKIQIFAAPETCRGRRLKYIALYAFCTYVFEYQKSNKRLAITKVTNG